MTPADWANLSEHYLAVLSAELDKLLAELPAALDSADSRQRVGQLIADAWPGSLSRSGCSANARRAAIPGGAILRDEATPGTACDRAPARAPVGVRGVTRRTPYPAGPQAMPLSLARSCEGGWRVVIGTEPILIRRTGYGASRKNH